MVNIERITNGVCTIDRFASMGGNGLAYCLGDCLPYNIIKKYEEDGEKSHTLTVKMRLEKDGKYMMLVIINSKSVFEDKITNEIRSIIIKNMDLLHV